MEIRVARYIGFCPGVKRAINAAERAREKAGGVVYTLGPLIHNPQVVEWLESKGVKALPESSRAYGRAAREGAPVVIRSHGVTPAALRELHSLGVTVVDATCPIVRKAQKAARGLVEEGYRLVIIGAADHPEVRAILGCVDGEAAVVEDREGLWCRDGRKPRKVGVIAQTTIDLSLFRELTCQLVGRVPELKVVDTLCRSTRARQQEARRLAAASDFVLVLGGRNSSNTNFLRRISLLSGTPTLQLEEAGELDTAVLSGVERLAILGGASTPEWIVEEVLDKVLKACPGQP